MGIEAGIARDGFSGARPGSVAPSLDAIAADPRRARALPSKVRSALIMRCAAVLAAISYPLHSTDADDAYLCEPFRTAKEAAQFLNVPETWIREQARAGRIPSTRVGHYVRFKLSEVEAALIARDRMNHPRVD